MQLSNMKEYSKNFELAENYFYEVNRFFPVTSSESETFLQFIDNAEHQEYIKKFTPAIDNSVV